MRYDNSEQNRKEQEQDSEKKGFWKKNQGQEQQGWKKWFQRDNLIVLILAGILLFIIALPTKDTALQQSEKTEKSQGGMLFGGNGDSVDVTSSTKQNETNNNDTGYDYVEYLEQRLEDVLAGISDVGRVKVMLTLQSSEELVVEKDTPISRSNTNETDSEGGSRVLAQTQTQETTIYRTEGSNSEPYVVKTILPRVEGVLVVAQGAGNGSVNKSITEIVQALFGVEAHKVKVVPMGNVQ